MASLGRPGVYIQESTVQQNATLSSRTDAIAAFVGSTARGPIIPTLVSSWSDFVNVYGGLDYAYPTTVAAYLFFTNGGRDAYIRRVVSGNSSVASTILKDKDVANSATISTLNPGAWGNTIAVQVTASDPVTKKFSLAVYGPPLTVSGASLTSNLLEQFNDLSLDSTSSRYASAIVNQFSNYISITVSSGNTTAAPPVGFASPVSLLSGSDGSVIGGGDITLSLTDFDIINAPLLFNAPDIATLAGASGTKTAAVTSQAALLRYAEARGDGFVVVDTPSGLSAFDAQVYATDVYNAATAASSTVASYSVSAASPGYSGSTVTTGSVTYTTGTTPHGFYPGQTVTLAGITSSATLSVPAAVTITPNTSGASGQNTVTVTSNAGIIKGMVVTGTAVGYASGATVLSTSGTTTVTLSANNTATWSTGTLIFTATAPTVVKAGYQDVTQVAGFVTFTTAAAHGFKNGDTVVISGVTNTITGNSTSTSAYNGTFIVTVVDTTTFYVANANTGTVTTLTSATAISSGYSGKFTITAVPSTVTFVTTNTETGTAILASATAAVTNSWTTATASGANGAIYYPWIAIPDTSKSVPGITKNVAPGGAVLGVYQETDASRGVFKTPAGYSASITLAVDVEIDSSGKSRRLTNEQLDSLNTGNVPVNPIRVVPGAGIVIMGGRTLTTTTPNRYINMRRSMIYIKKQVEFRSQFAVFENNDEYLWRQLRSSLSNFLNMYWQQGGLRGASPEQAFFVKCDGSTTSDSDIAGGLVNIQVGVALEYPAEFIVINIGQLTGSATAF